MIEIPVKLILEGDRDKSSALIGESRRVMLVLENMMRLRKLDQLSITLEPYSGASITCSKVFGRRVTKISTSGEAVGAISPQKVCICNCNLSEGWILEVQENNIGGAQLYTVMACINRGHAYKKYEDILASDFSPYEVGQKILLTSYNNMAYLCCTSNSGGESGVTGCRPLKSEKQIDDEDWRTTYRILPWCAIQVPKLLDSSRWRSG